MKRKNKKEIQKYYQINDVASTYDDRRFVGKGGEYINSTEVKTTLNIMKKCLRVDSPKILDLGSGRGRLSIPLKKAGYNTYCLDSSVSMLAFLTKEHISFNKLISLLLKISFPLQHSGPNLIFIGRIL